MGCWASLVYCFMGVEPRRKCGQTATERRYIGEMCWSCNTGLSQPLPPSHPSAALPLSSAPQRRSRSPPSGGVAPRAYMPEPMMTMGPSPYSSTSAAVNRAIPPSLARPQPALVIPTPSSSRRAPVPQVISIPSVPSRSSPARRAATAPPSRPPRPHPSQSPFPHLSSAPARRGRSSSSPFASYSNGSSSRNAPPLTRPRPTLSVASAPSLPRFASATSQSQSRSVRAAPPRQPMTSASAPACMVGGGSSRAQPAKKTKSPSLILSKAATRPSTRQGLKSRISSALLRSPKSSESFACAEARRVERGSQ
ncbi:hypothetical protein SCUCBS95973_006085 [Sporothrix curviconia]|uniref:Uncharacterized protein n=1 Tax=Sporothrix curviconia TaxID=1260050 RepID=A0ABP0C4I2_9PEZI